MDKGVGFNQYVSREWLDTTAALRAESEDPAEIRERLEPILRAEGVDPATTRKSIDILINIWHKSQAIAPNLHSQALALFEATPMPGERLYLHYGLALLYYPFLRDCLAVIGHLGRYEETVTTMTITRRMAAELGYLGGLERAMRRVTSSLRNWGVLQESERLHHYAPLMGSLATTDRQLEAWLLRAALLAHDADEIPIGDLLHLPALFPFNLTLTAYELRHLPGFEVHRQGLGLDMVRAV